MLLAAALAACAAPQPLPTATETRAAPEGIDGRYRGIARLTRATVAGCPRSGSRVVTISGNALSLNYRGQRASYALAAIVGPDGSVHGSDNTGTIDGQITGRHLDLSVSSQYCDVRYALDKAS
ncbi:hypothetical protein [Acidisphaera sp. L21]|jgi:hypothetical protein|uniref:hypothetical protein n=1 Tax=Acidisphaera sp. L21 TaxID=1641851 RepID=UPI00131A9B5A|nr:hypothetical protein [Acidisphaera sp. L21]